MRPRFMTQVLVTMYLALIILRLAHALLFWDARYVSLPIQVQFAYRFVAGIVGVTMGRGESSGSLRRAQSG